MRRRLAVLLCAMALAAPARASEMAFLIKNHRADAIAVELFSHDRDEVWPGGDKVFLLDPASQKSIPISCNPGENICYGAWVSGNDAISGGVGPDDDRDCENCCFICVDKTTETIDLVP